MAEQIKLTKTQLRDEQLKLSQLQKYLPTLQLKKAMLQMEVNNAEAEEASFRAEFQVNEDKVTAYSALLSDKSASDLISAVTIKEVKKRYENIAGVDLPFFEEVEFEPATYFFFDTPVWLDSAIVGVQNLLIAREKLKTVQEKKRALLKELREVSIRVNLFEKIMIPRAQSNIKKIKIFLSDQGLAAVCQAKVAKHKISLQQLQKRKRA